MLELAGLSPTCLQDRHREENNATGAVGAQSSVIGGRESLRVSTGAMPVQALNFSDDGGAAGPDDDHDGGDDLPVDPENNMEVTPAANEHIEPQRVGQAGFSRALEPGCPAAHCLTLLLCLPECAPGERLRAAAASPC